MKENIYFEKNGDYILRLSTPKHEQVDFLIDKDDINRMKAFHWMPSRDKLGGMYAVTGMKMFEDGKNKRVQIKMHRFIASFEADVIDHKNGNTLDNRKSNLRAATAKENTNNRSPNKKSKSKTKGVCLMKKTGKFRAYIYHNYENIHLGFFVDFKDACIAYNDAAIEMFGQFARLNEV